jgi:hypothetical protein
VQLPPSPLSLLALSQAARLCDRSLVDRRQTRIDDSEHRTLMLAGGSDKLPWRKAVETKRFVTWGDTRRPAIGSSILAILHARGGHEFPQACTFSLPMFENSTRSTALGGMPANSMRAVRTTTTYGAATASSASFVLARVFAGFMGGHSSRM